MARNPQHSWLSTHRKLSLSSLGLGAVVLVSFLLVSETRAAPPPKPVNLAEHTVVVADSGSPSNTQVQSATADCPDGTGVIAGGFSFGNTGVDDFLLIASRPHGEYTVQEPNGDPIHINSGWIVTIKRLDGQTADWIAVAYAICVSID